MWKRAIRISLKATERYSTLFYRRKGKGRSKKFRGFGIIFYGNFVTIRCKRAHEHSKICLVTTMDVGAAAFIKIFRSVIIQRIIYPRLTCHLQSRIRFVGYAWSNVPLTIFIRVFLYIRLFLSKTTYISACFFYFYFFYTAISCYGLTCNWPFIMNTMDFSDSIFKLFSRRFPS